MNKYVLMGLIFLYLMIITLLADSLLISTSGDIIGGINAPSTAGGTSGILDLLGTFWKMISFQIDLPNIVLIIFVYPPVLIVVFMIIDVLKDLIPFT